MIKPAIGSLWTLDMGDHTYTGMVTGYEAHDCVRLLVLTSDRASAIGDTYTSYLQAFSLEKEEDRDVWLPLV